MRLRTYGEALRGRLVEWPVDGEPLVLLSRRDFDSIVELDDEPRPDIVIAEAADERELRGLSETVARIGALGLLIAGSGKIRDAAVRDAQSLSADVTVLAGGESRPAVLAAAARALEELVRRRTYLVLLQHWRRELTAREEHLRKILGGTLPPAAIGPRPTIAPLSSILDAHIAGVLGLWWPGTPKAAKHLGVSHPTLRRMRGRVPTGIAAAIDPPPPASHLDLLIIEDERPLAEALRRTFTRIAEKHNRRLDISIATSAAEARQKFEAGFPSLLWCDIHLETPRAGIELVEWMRLRGAPSVVIGKTTQAPARDIRRMTVLGALTVWTGDMPPNLDGLLVDGLRAADEGQEIAALERRARSIETRLRPVLERAADSAALLDQLTAYRQIVSGLEAEVLATTFPGVGDPQVTLASIRATAASHALAATDGHRGRAAGALGIDPSTLHRILSREEGGAGDAGGDDDEP